MTKALEFMLLTSVGSEGRSRSSPQYAIHPMYTKRYSKQRAKLVDICEAGVDLGEKESRFKLCSFESWTEWRGKRGGCG